VTAVRFTPEQRAAIADRGGSSLLAANAGSGKTAVMAERVVEAVIDDGVAVAAILALTFTEKAAGELRERVRRRFAELGHDEAARAVDGSWIGTIHGFCARVLRAQPLAAGLDPRFDVLDEPAAARLARGAYERAFEAWAAARGEPALDLSAAYGAGLRDIVFGAHATLRSRGETHPILPVPPPRPAPDPAAFAAARAEAATLGLNGQAQAALDACARVLARGGVPVPGDLAAAELKGRARPETERYRVAFAAYSQACADHHARAALVVIADLLDRYGAAYAEAKRARAGLDFEDLELGVRDLLAADDGLRRRWAERFALIMVDEFQDTNRLQLDVLEALERDNLFAVGDEFQSIYRFRHADVTIFRERRRALGEGRVRPLTANFRSREELLDVLNAAFAPQWREHFAPLLAGVSRNGAGELRLFDPAAHDASPPAPPVELLLTDCRGWEDDDRVGLGGHDAKPHRRAEARLVARRLREEIDAGRAPGEIVVLVRATASLRLFEQALEEQGIPTYVVGGRGYWSQQAVRDGLAYLSALANPLDEEALLGVLASPFCGVRSDALVLLARDGRQRGDGLWAALQRAAAGVAGVGPTGVGALDAVAAGEAGAGPAGVGALDAVAAGEAGAGPAGVGALDAGAAGERQRLHGFTEFFTTERAQAERLPVEVLLERALTQTGYDLAVLARTGGERRLANLRKLMRLAREYERAEGRDLRGFLAYAATQDVTEAREGEAPLESEGLDAVRLMTIHRAKGLEFPVVCVADLGRQGVTQRERLLLGRDGSVGLRLSTPAGGDSVPALAYERLAAEAAAEDEAEERRLFYVAMTRACDRLILSGTLDPERRPEPRPGGPPIDWILPAVIGDTPLDRPQREVERTWDGRPARVRLLLSTPETIDPTALAPTPRPRASAPGTSLPAAPKVMPAHGPPRPAAPRLSYSALQQYAKCPYRFYLQRTLRLPEERPPLGAAEAAEAAALGQAEAVAPEAVGTTPAEPAPPVLDPRVRGSIAHLLLEELDFGRPEAPAAEEVGRVASDLEVELTDAEVEDLRVVVGAFAASPLCARLAAAPRVRREAGFAFALEIAGGPLVTGFVDVHARLADDSILIVDYKTDRLDGADPAELVERDYATQRAIYALAALKAGAPAVEVAYCVLERPAEPVSARFAASEAGALAERVTTLAEGVLEARYPVAREPHRDLCGDCPGRGSMCSWPESMTLREPPAQASAGTFSGSGGPS